jgi:Fic family protein
MVFEPINLPLPEEAALETRAVLKKAASAHRYLAELKGVSASIPNEAIVINTLTMQEAKDSSEIENIITTHDELFKAGLEANALNPAAKEVQNYAVALQAAFRNIRASRLIRLQDILDIQQTLERNNAGLRRQSGTTLKNQQTGEVVYTPPQDPGQIQSLMANLT